MNLKLRVKCNELEAIFETIDKTHSGQRHYSLHRNKEKPKKIPRSPPRKKMEPRYDTSAYKMNVSLTTVVVAQR